MTVAPSPAARSAIAPRKQPQQARAAATVTAVVEAAARILETQGLAGFNTNAVARKAGVAIGSLYQYFPGKDAILAALIRREAEAFDHALGEAIRAAEGLPVSEAVARLAAVAVEHQASRPGLARLLDLEEQRLDLGEEARDAQSRTLATVAEFLAARGLGGIEAAADLLDLSRGLVDGALARGAREGLEHRLTSAALGYLAALQAKP